MLLDSDRNRLRHMLDAAEQAISFAEGRSREDLDADRQFLFALIRCLEIVGEAAARVSAELREEQPCLPWAKGPNARSRENLPAAVTGRLTWEISGKQLLQNGVSIQRKWAVCVVEEVVVIETPRAIDKGRLYVPERQHQAG